MAKTGSITITTNSQSVANNTSSITVKGIITTSGESYRGDHRTGTYTIKQGSTTIKSGSFTHGAPANSTTTLFSVTLTVTHNTDGTSGTITASYNYDSSWCTASKSTTLTTIPRASSVSMGTGTMGSSSTITISRASSSFTHTLQYYFGSASGTIATKTSSTSVSWTPSLDLAKQIPSATSGKGTLRCITYSGSTQVGQKDISITLNVPSSMIPTISSASITVDNSANSVIKGWGLYVVGYSKAKITAAASGSYGSTISSFTISGGYSKTVSGTSLSWTGSTFTSSGSKTFNVVAKDSRGRSSASTSAGTITVYAYSKPAMSSFTVSRSSSNVSQMVAKANWSYSTVNSKNTTTATLYYKKSTETSWTTYGTISKNTSTTLTTTFDETSSYNFRVVVADSLSNSAEAEAFVSTVEVLMDFRAGGKGLGIGKIAETDSLEVGLDSHFYNQTVFEKQNVEKQGSYVHYTRGTSGTAGYARIATIKVNTNYANVPIEFKLLQRRLTPAVYSITFANADSTDPALSTFYHYNITTPAYLVKTTTSTWDFYVQKSEAYDGISVVELNNSKYMEDAVTITWQSDQVSTLPSGYVTSEQYEIVLGNKRTIYGLTTDGVSTDMLHLSTSDNIVLGYGSYTNANGNTHIYGNDIKTYSTAAGLSGRSYGVNKVLWSGAYYMTASHNITLSEAIAAQPHGILLGFSAYSSSAAQNYHWHWIFVPKYHVSAHSSAGICCLLVNRTGTYASIKYLYVSNTVITGHDDNSGTFSNDALPLLNTQYVLRYVVGV